MRPAGDFFFIQLSNTRGKFPYYPLLVLHHLAILTYLIYNKIIFQGLLSYNSISAPK